MHLRPIKVRILLPHQQAQWASAFCGEASEPTLEGKPCSPSVFPIEKSENGEVGQGPWPLSSTRPILWDDNKLANFEIVDEDEDVFDFRLSQFPLVEIK